MNTAQLRNLHLSDLSGLCVDCGLVSAEEANGGASHRRPSRDQMVARIMAWQEQNRGAGALAGGRWPATPSGKRTAPSTEGAAEAAACATCQCRPSKGGGCACGFLQMDPLRPVARVLAFGALSPDSRARPHLGEARLEFRHRELEHGEEVELRMAQRSSPVQHQWPRSLAVRLGEREVARVEPQREDGPRRREAPMQLTEHLPRAAGALVSLEVYVDAAPRLAEDFLYCLVRTAPPRGVCDLLTDCLSRPPRPASESLALWAQLRASEEEAGVQCASAWSQPLLCPISHERMEVPARGQGCRHLRCFDLEAYLVASARAVFHRRWRCPVCDSPLLPGALAVCGLTQRLLREAPAGAAEAALGPLEGLEPPLLGAVAAPDAAPLQGIPAERRNTSEEKDLPPAFSTPPRPSPPRLPRASGWCRRAVAAEPEDRACKLRPRRWRRGVLPLHLAGPPPLATAPPPEPMPPAKRPPAAAAWGRRLRTCLGGATRRPLAPDLSLD